MEAESCVCHAPASAARQFGRGPAPVKWLVSPLLLFVLLLLLRLRGGGCVRLLERRQALQSSAPLGAGIPMTFSFLFAAAPCSAGRLLPLTALLLLFTTGCLSAEERDGIARKDEPFAATFSIQQAARSLDASAAAWKAENQ